MRKETYTCDVCGVERGPANHWLGAVARNGLFTICRPMDLTDEYHLCGQECAHKLLSSYLGNPPL